MCVKHLTIGLTFIIFGIMKPLQISKYTLVTALGRGVQANLQQLQSGESGLTPCGFFDVKDISTWVGEVNGLEEGLTGDFGAFDCRNNRLAKVDIQSLVAG